MSRTPYFVYGTAEIKHLQDRDEKLGEAIDRIGPIKRAVIPDLYSALVNAIVGQQISTKAQATIWQRMQERFSPFTPATLGSIPIEELQACGITWRKATYIHEMTQAVLKGELDRSLLQTMSDNEVCAELTKLRGIGMWTAEMILIFSLQRPDVVSYNDLAIQRGMRMLYGHRKINPQTFAKYRSRYSPYGSTASLYLWAIAGGALSELTDPEDESR